MHKVFYVRISNPRRAASSKRPTVSHQKAIETAMGSESVTPPSVSALELPSNSPGVYPSRNFASASLSPVAGPTAHLAVHPGLPPTTGAIGAFTLNQPLPAAPPEFDERFNQVKARLSGLAKVERWHEPLPNKMKQAAKATRQPVNEPVAEGMESHVEEMSKAEAHPAAEPQNAESFQKVLERSLEKIPLETSSDMEDLAENPTRRNDVQGDIRENVEQRRDASKKDLAAAAQHPPPMGNVEPEAGDLPALPRRGAPIRVNAEDALPLPKSDSEISFLEDQEAAQSAVSKTSLTEEELTASNEPSFTRILAERDSIVSECVADAAKFRQQEAGFLKRSAQEATVEENQVRSAMRQRSTGKHSDVRNRQDQLARNNETERSRIALGMQVVYVATKILVDAKLASLGPLVDDLFTRSFNILFDVLQQDVHDDMEAWEEKRHSGLTGKALWWKDKAVGTSHLKQAKKIYKCARCKFEKSMHVVFGRIAKLVDDTLDDCRKAIAAGNGRLEELRENERDPKLKEYADETASRIKGDFDNLQFSIEEKKNELANSLANRYKDSRAAVDKWIAEDKQKRKGPLMKLRDAAVEIYDIVVNFKDKLMSVLRRGVSIILSIIRHPIRFLENLVASVKQGISQFTENIGEHMREAAFSWIFGEIPASEIHLPKDVSPASMFGLAMEVLNFTPEHVRARALHIVGAQNVAVFESVLALLDKYFHEGPSALWEELESMLGGMKETIIDGIRDWVLAQVVRRGIAQLALMLNPVGAFIEACIAIYNLIVFFIDHARQIGEMLSGVFDSVEDMVEGRIDSAANRVEAAMTRAVSMILNFLVSLIGVPSPAGAIRRIIGALRDKITAALDWLLEKLKKTAMKLGVAVKTTAGKVFHLLFPKETFEADGEIHTIDAVESGHDYAIVVHSNGVDMETLIKEAKDNKVKGATALETAYREYEKVPIKEVFIKDKNEREARHDEIEKEGQKKIAAFEKVAKLIKDVFPKIPSLTKRKPKTLVTYGPEKTVSVGRATKKKDVVVGGTMMVVEPLAHDNLDKGTDTATAIPPIMVDSSWTSSRQGLYKRGHLLNRLLGGPGEESRNITPLTSSANALHNTRVESNIKKLMNARVGELIHYEVHVNYPDGPRKVAGSEDDVERMFAISLSTKWWELEPEGTGYKKKPGSEPGGETIPNVPPYP